MRVRLLCLGLAVVFVFVSLAGAPAAAQELAFNLSPLLVELQGAPGGTARFTVFVNHEGRSQAVAMRAYVASVREMPDGRYELVDDPDIPYSAAGWITISPERFTLAPGEAVTIHGEAQIPRNAHGGRYAAVVLEVEPDPDRDPGALGSSVFRYRMASIVELTVGARLQRRAYISGIEVVPAAELDPLGRQFSEEALAVRASLTNEGNVHVFGRGSATIRNEAGRRVQQIPLGQGRGAVLPEATLDFTSILSRGLPPGEYTVQAVIYFGGLRPAIAQGAFTVEDGRVQTEGEWGVPSVRFDVQPGEVELELPEGGVRFRTATVVNADDSPIQVHSLVQPLIHDVYGEIDPSAMADADPLDWIEVTPSELILAPGQRRNVRLSIRNLADGAAGRYAQVTFRASRLDAETGKPVEGGLVSDVGSNVSVLSFERPAPQARIDFLQLVPGGDGRELYAAAEIENVGSIHFQGQGQFALLRHVMPELEEGVVYDGEGWFEPIWERPAGEDALQKVLPGERRQISLGIGDSLEPGRYRLEFRLHYGGAVPLMETVEWIAAET